MGTIEVNNTALRFEVAELQGRWLIHQVLFYSGTSGVVDRPSTGIIQLLEGRWLSLTQLTRYVIAHAEARI